MGAGPDSRRCSLGSPKDSTLGLILCCHCFEILNNSRSRGTHLHSTLGPTNDVANLGGQVRRAWDKPLVSSDTGLCSFCRVLASSGSQFLQMKQKR